MSWRVVRSFFQRHPLAANMASYGSLYIGAEMSQQTLIRHLDDDMKGKPYDWPLIARYGIYSIVLAGPGLFFWYRWLDGRLIGSNFKMALTKSLTDQLVSSTICTCVFYTTMSVMEGKKDIFEELKKKFVPTYKFSCLFWIPVQCINFAFVPPAARVVTVGMCSFAWVNILCVCKRTTNLQ